MSKYFKNLRQYIRYAGVINAYGRTLTGIVRSNPNLKPMLKSEQVKNEFFIISTLMSIEKEHINISWKTRTCHFKTPKSNDCNFTEKKCFILYFN